MCKATSLVLGTQMEFSKFVELSTMILNKVTYLVAEGEDLTT